MTSVEAKPETARGRWTLDDGVEAKDLRRQLHALTRDSMLWRLQINCLRYCSFVHSHHGAEDADFFTELRDTNPAINPVIDRLRREHRRVSHDLDAVEAAANALGDDAGQPARKALVDTLLALRENLLAHLDYEERSIEATVRRVRELS